MKRREKFVLIATIGIATFIFGSWGYYELTKPAPEFADPINFNSLMDCPAGTSFHNNTGDQFFCLIEPDPPLSDSVMLGIGIAIAALATGVGLILTWIDRKDQAKQRNQEIVQMYSEELREISNQELNLKTKQECALYAEQYLDTVEKIATLQIQGVFDEKTMGYFENNYTYARDLWWWYHLNIHGINNDTQDVIFEINYKSKFDDVFKDDVKYLDPPEEAILKDFWGNWKDSEPEVFKKANLKTISEESRRILETVWEGDVDTDLKDIFGEKGLEKIKKDGKYTEDDLKKKKEVLDKFVAYRNFVSQDRWPDFRNWCIDQNITDFAYNFRGIGGKDNSSENWRVLPDVMYYDYEDLPVENGLSKSEFVGIIMPYAKVLADFVEKEKEMKSSEEFEIYAEQYLETLEQIATLYRHEIIPTKASEYFENKFSYGCNLWGWYHHVVLKYSEKLHKALWGTITEVVPEEEFTKNQIKKWTKEKTLEQKIDEKYDDESFGQFLTSYSNNNVKYAVSQLMIEDPDVWKIIKLASNAGISRAKSKLSKMQSIYDKVMEEKDKVAEVKTGAKIIEQIIQEILNIEISHDATKEKIDTERTRLSKMKLPKLEKEISKLVIEEILEIEMLHDATKEEINTERTRLSKMQLSELEKEYKISQAKNNLENAKIDVHDAEILKNKASQHVTDIQDHVKEIKDQIHLHEYTLSTCTIAAVGKSPTSDEARAVEKASLDLKDEKAKLAPKLKELTRSDDFTEEDVQKLLKEFVTSYLDGERWEDFRWWCKKKNITPFEDDPSEGLILPLKMWRAQYQ